MGYSVECPACESVFEAERIDRGESGTCHTCGHEFEYSYHEHVQRRSTVLASNVGHGFEEDSTRTGLMNLTLSDGVTVGIPAPRVLNLIAKERQAPVAPVLAPKVPMERASTQNEFESIPTPRAIEMEQGQANRDALPDDSLDDDNLFDVPLGSAPMLRKAETSSEGDEALHQSDLAHQTLDPFADQESPFGTRSATPPQRDSLPDQSEMPLQNEVPLANEIEGKGSEGADVQKSKRFPIWLLVSTLGAAAILLGVTIFGVALIANQFLRNNVDSSSSENVSSVESNGTETQGSESGLPPAGDTPKSSNSSFSWGWFAHLESPLASDQSDGDGAAPLSANTVEMISGLENLFKQCDELDWFPGDRRQYEFFADLALKLVEAESIAYDSGSEQSERLALEAATMEIRKHLQTVGWPTQALIVRVNRLAVTSFSQQDEGVYCFATVAEAPTTSADFPGGGYVLMDLEGTVDQIVLPVSQGTNSLQPGSRWLVVGKHAAGDWYSLKKTDREERRAAVVYTLFLVNEPEPISGQ